MDNDKNKSKFDPDFLPEHPINKEAAKAHDLKYDPMKRSYVDEDGCLMRDEFGQEY